MAKDRIGQPIPRALKKHYEQVRYDNYHLALGAFVDAFSHAESVMHSCLYHHSKVSNEVRRAVLSGVRIKEGIGFLRRLADVGEIDPEEWAKLKLLLDHLSILTDRRNRLLHQGAEYVETGEPYTSNNTTALTLDRYEEFSVTPGELHRMTHDLHTIFFAISCRHAGQRYYENRKRARQHAEKRGSEPWQYIPKPLK